MVPCHVGVGSARMARRVSQMPRESVVENERPEAPARSVAASAHAQPLRRSTIDCCLRSSVSGKKRGAMSSPRMARGVR